MRLVSGGVLVVRQVASITAAFALIGYLSHFLNFEWHGFMATLVAQWNETVRPATAWLCHLLVTVPLGWIGWHVEIPLVYRDYLSVSVALGLSLMRAESISERAAGRKFVIEADDIAITAIAALFWPVLVPFLIYFAFAEYFEDEDRWWFSALAVAPAGYLLLLLAINYLVL